MLSRDEAYELLKKYNQDPFHIQHALTMEAVMKWYADELGYGILVEIAQRLRHAREKHDWHGSTHIDAANAVLGEAMELGKAVLDGEGRTREHDEALDTAVVAIKYIGEEWE